MQEYRELLPTGYLKDDREAINKNFESIVSDFAGTAFPTQNLIQGMKCDRTDQKKIYRLKNVETNQWVEIYDYRDEVEAVPKATNATNAKSAEQAENATNDGNGKNIAKTYVAGVTQNEEMEVVVEKGDGTTSKFKAGDVTQNGLGVRENNETIKAGEIRFLYGRENAGKVILYTQDGVTGSEQPDFEEDTPVGMIFPENADLSYAPLGFPFPNPLPYIPDGCVPALGQESTVETYPVFKYIQLRHPEMVITEEQWQQMATENNGHVPYYSSGNGSTTFRFPCLLHYFCATSDGQKLGKYEADGLPNIEGRYQVGTDTGFAVTEGGQNGALYIEEKNYTYWLSGNTGTPNGELMLDASRSNSIYGNADEVRPKTAYGTWIIRAYGAIPTSEELEAAGLVQSVSNVETKLRELEVKVSELENNTIIIYPNEGTAEQPANIVKNTRYIEGNPFKGYHVSCEAQILYNGKWGATNFTYTANGETYGVYIGQLLPDDSIILVTGRNGLSTSWDAIGNVFPDFPGAGADNLPCRVIVHKLSKIEGSEA